MQLTNPGPSLQAKISKSYGTSYLAEADGFLTADGTATAVGNISVEIFSDSSNPPTTSVAAHKMGNASGNNIMNCSAFIKKGNYYKAVLTNCSQYIGMYWQPFK